MASSSNKKECVPGQTVAASHSQDETRPTPKKRENTDISTDRGSGNTSSNSPNRGASIQQMLTRKLNNPLEGLNEEQLALKGEKFCSDNNIVEAEDVRAFRLGAILAGAPRRYDRLEDVTDEERSFIAKEYSRGFNRWGIIPIKLWFQVVVCSLCAAVQGMDETTVNGAQIFYKHTLGIQAAENSELLLGFVNSAPYLCCAILSCWMTPWLNNRMGRRGTIAFCCFISGVACLGQALCQDWKQLLAVRALLGLGIGPKSATTPMYAAECAPPKLRGALTMQWQVWTAFGIMAGFAVDLAFLRMADDNLKWRFMVASTLVPAFLVCALTPFCPESPRHLLSKNKSQKAYESMCKLRKTKLQAARDIFHAKAILEVEDEAREMRDQAGKGKLLGGLRELFLERRNRNAFLASEIVMFMQQFCGVNVIAYYSAHFLLDQNIGRETAFGISLGWGMTNWLGAIPAIFTIDRFGRRSLLLVTFPLMFAALLFTGFSCEWLTGTAKTACIIAGTYFFVVVYSPGAGPVPFTYSAEAYPLHIRALGMSIATATTWFFNFVLALTFPMMQKAMRPVGAFGFYAGFNIVGFLLTLFLVPETKGFSLEDLDGVFGVPARDTVAYGWAQVEYAFKRLRGKADAVRPEVPFKCNAASGDGPMRESKSPEAVVENLEV